MTKNSLKSPQMGSDPQKDGDDLRLWRDEPRWTKDDGVMAVTTQTKPKTEIGGVEATGVGMPAPAPAVVVPEPTAATAANPVALAAVPTPGSPLAAAAPTTAIAATGPSTQMTVNTVPAQGAPQAMSAQGAINATSARETSANAAATAAAAAATADGGADTIRVQVGLLDKLMNLAGELVLIRNQVVQHAAKQTGEFLNLSQRLSLLTSELQNEVMKTRMQPIGNILTKFSRIVRDGARDLNKQIEVQIEGAETELDKTLIESIKDPLTHIVRNAIDHGIEFPEVRRKNGKSPSGTLKVKAYHEGGQVIVEIADDGQGLNRARIGAKAVERGLIAAQALEAMSDRDVHQLIFAPGLSTAEKVSSLSGRGVGMDVVRTNIEKIGGVVDLTSVEGQGTTIRLKIPLTLAIIPALIVRAAGERFAIPQIKLVELVRVEQTGDGSGPRLETLQGQPVFRLRGNLLPLISLSETLGKTPPRGAPAPGEVTNIIVLNADKSLFGLIVDEIEDSIDIVVKPLSNFLKSLNTYTGATVMGDGTIALTLDVLGLAERARLLDSEDQIGRGDGDALAEQESLKNRSDYILLDIGAPGLYSVPLKQVKRLEELTAASISVAGEQRVVRYREAILPIVTVTKKLGLQVGLNTALAADDQTVPIVVVESEGRLIGLEVRRILDIFSTQLPLDKRATDRPGILGSMIVDQKIVGVIDIAAMIGE